MKKILALIIPFTFMLAACQPKPSPSLSPEQTAEFLENGREIVQASFTALSGQLAGAMQKGGVQNAVSYCNLQANPIIDSLSQVHQATISRVTLRPRNPENLADENESSILADYLKVKSSGDDMVSFVQTGPSGQVTFYSPIIIISPLCLKCHGAVGTEIETTDYELIQSLYSNDQATGYSMHELRGMWKVAFK